MLRYKFNVAEALERIGFNTYQAKTTKILSQDTLKKLKNDDTSITLDTLNRLCVLLDMEPKNIIEYIEDDKEIEKYRLAK